MRGANLQLDGVRAILVEDEPYLRLELSDMLGDCGCRIVGAVGRVDPAVSLVEQNEFDIALLDVNLGGEKVGPVVAAVERRGVPYVLLTGYGASAAEAHPNAVIVEKPYEPARLVGAMRRALDGEG